MGCDGTRVRRATVHYDGPTVQFDMVHRSEAPDSAPSHRTLEPPHHRSPHRMASEHYAVVEDLVAGWRWGCASASTWEAPRSKQWRSTTPARSRACAWIRRVMTTPRHSMSLRRSLRI